MKPYALIRTEVARLLQVAPDGAYAQKNIRDYLQRRYKRIYETEDWPGLLEIADVTLAANANTFLLAKKYDHILRAFPEGAFWAADLYHLAHFGEQTLPDKTVIGTIYDMASLGKQGVQTQLTASNTPTIKSSDAADTAVPITIEGEDANGNIISVSTNTDATVGTTSVSVGTAFTRITKVSKAKITAGTISMLNAAGTTTLATIAFYEHSPEYHQYRTGQTPAAATTITCIVKRAHVPFIRLTSMPFMEMDDALLYGAVADGWSEHRQLDMAADYEARYQAELGNILSREINRNSGLLTMAPAGRF